LRSFFDDWLRRPGYARFGISEVRYEGGAVDARLQYEGHPYRIPLEVMLEYPDGSRTFRTIDTGGLRFDGGGATLRIPSNRRPSIVSFDPWRRIVRQIQADEEPPSLRGIARMPRFDDPSRPHFHQSIRSSSRLAELPKSLDGVFITGHPDTLPVLAELCRRIGFEVQSHLLTYQGVTIDLRNGSALALVDLADGGICAIGLGNAQVPPQTGRARVAITDLYGRFLRGRTDPKRSGNLVFRLDGDR
jgi:hypothetical protein